MADYTYVTDTGVIVPDTADTRQQVIDEFRAIFGDDLITDDETPEGAWINAETTSRQSVARNNATVANLINPNLAGGPALDDIWALTGGQRTTPTRSTVSCTVTGVSGTRIPQGSRATTTAGAVFRAAQDLLIPTSGTLTSAPFESDEFGAIEAAASTLTTISDPVLGWETITNPDNAVTGTNPESDGASRLRRRQTLGLQGRAISEAVTSNVMNVAGVQSLAFRENTAATTMTIDGISLVAHSIWVSVQGGIDADIAAALLRSKTAGAAWNGDQSVTVTDRFSGQSYTVQFDRPTDTPVLIRLTVRNTSNIADPITSTRNSVLRYARGEIPGEPGFTVGSDVSPFEISGAVNIDNPAVYVTLVEVALDVMTPVYQSTVLPVSLDAIASTTESAITVMVAT